VHRKIIVKQLHKIEKVPRVFGEATKLVLGGGRVQLGLKSEASVIEA
jgi:hypothetical protein